MNNELDIKSYLIGVFDGEGCVGTGRNAKGNWFVQVSVTMASQEICELFVQTWGGGIHVRSKVTVGGLTLFNWHINATKAIPFLEYAVLHSRTKRKQSEIALKIAYQMKKYIDGVPQPDGSRKRQFLTDLEKEERNQLVLELRSLNGARSRFSKNVQLEVIE